MKKLLLLTLLGLQTGWVDPSGQLFVGKIFQTIFQKNLLSFPSGTHDIRPFQKAVVNSIFSSHAVWLVGHTCVCDTSGCPGCFKGCPLSKDAVISKSRDRALNLI